MTITNRTLGVALLCMAMFCTAVVLIELRPAVVEGSSFPSAPAIAVATTSTSFSITTSARILSTTTSFDPNNNYHRAYSTICTVSSNPVAINLDGDKPTSPTSVTTWIAAASGYNNCYEVKDDRIQYNGSITASSTNQTATVITVKDYVY